MISYKKNIECIYCNITIKNYSYWKRHLKTKKHIRNKELTERGLKEKEQLIKENNNYCNICDINIKHYKNWKRHLKSLTHNNNIKTINNNTTNNKTDKINFSDDFLLKLKKTLSIKELRLILDNEIYNKK